MKSESCAESPRAHSFPCKRGGGQKKKSLKTPFCGTNHVRTEPFSVTGHLIGAIKSINIRAKTKIEDRAPPPLRKHASYYIHRPWQRPPHWRPLLVGAHRVTTVEASRCPVNSPVIPVSPFRRCPTTKKSKCLHFPHLVPTDHHTGRRIII